MTNKVTRSARGEVVNFDLLAIKEQLSLKPTPVGVDARRKFIDRLDGLKPRREIVADEVTQSALPQVDMSGPLGMAAAAAQESAAASSQDSE